MQRRGLLLHGIPVQDPCQHIVGIDAFHLFYQLVVDDAPGNKPCHRFQDPPGIDFFRGVIVICSQITDNPVIVIKGSFNYAMDILYFQDLIYLGFGFAVGLYILHDKRRLVAQGFFPNVQIAFVRNVLQ